MQKRIKQILSATAGLVAFVLLCSEPDDPTDLGTLWLQLVAGAVFVAVLAWNGVFHVKEAYGK